MLLNQNYSTLFSNPKPIIGMLHLAGKNNKDIINRAVREAHIYEQNRVNGVIVEDYHGNLDDIVGTLDALNEIEISLTVGVNFLRNPYHSFYLADKFGAKFVQFDCVEDHGLGVEKYEAVRSCYPDLVVFGGVHFKGHQTPSEDVYDPEGIKTGMSRAEVIVTTGSSTGRATPLTKLTEFKEHMGAHPLFIGSGLTPESTRSQLAICDGAIVGSWFKYDNDTSKEVDPERVREIIEKRDSLVEEIINNIH